MVQWFVRDSAQTRLQSLVLIGLMQWQRDAVIAMEAGSGLADFVRRSALGMRQLDGYAGEVTNALMTADQQIDGVFGFRFVGGERVNLVQHVTLLSPRETGAEKAVASRQFLPTTDNWLLTTVFHHFSNFISTVTCTGTACPFFSAGRNFHFFTVFTALSSKAGSSLRRTRTTSTRPLALMPTNMTTVPCCSASGGRSGNFGSGASVAFGGFMSLVMRWKCEKVWSSAKSAGEVERVEEDSGRALPACARAVAARNDREIDRAISVRVRIKFPESCKRYGYLIWKQAQSKGASQAFGALQGKYSVQVVKPFCAAYCKLRLPVLKPSVCLIARGFPQQEGHRSEE